MAFFALAGCIGGKSANVSDSAPGSSSGTGTPTGTPSGTPVGTLPGSPSGTPGGTPTGTATGTTPVRADCALPGTRDGSDANTTLDGPASSESGIALGSGGDIDGDGFEDLVIGAPNEDSWTGAAWLVFGSAGPQPSGALSIGFAGNTQDSSLGAAVRILGDMDGDGFDEVAVGAAGESGDPSGAISRGGVVHVRYGSATRPVGIGSVGTWDVHIDGSEDYAQAGRALAAGDHNGDGLADLAWSVPDLGGGASRGGVFLLHGDPVRPAPDLLDTGFPAIRGAVIYDPGIELGDTDGDGLDDLVLAYQWYSDAYVSVQYGTTAALPGSVVATSLPGWIDTGVDVNGFARDMVLVDLDADGYRDIVVSDHTANGLAPTGGWVRLIRGGASRPVPGTAPAWDLVIQGVEADGYVGSSLANAGDLDCDGVDDLAVGAMLADGLLPDSGLVGLFWGNPSGVMSFSAADLRIDGDIGGAWFGAAIAAGNLDGDPGPELAIGANHTGGNAGRTYLFLDGFP